MPTSNHTTYCIYRIVCFATGRVYIGQTNNYAQRYRDHINKLKKGKHVNKQLQRAVNKYGLERFYFEIIEEGLSFEKSNEREIFWIKHYDSFANGFNATSGGRSSPTRSVQCVWNGIEYGSIADAARATGINLYVITWRISQGFTRDEDVKPYMKKCEWNGCQYQSITEAANAIGVTENAMKHRVKSGFKSDADMKGKGGGAKVKCEWNGISYSSFSAAAKANGVSSFVMRWRIKKGYRCDSDIAIACK